MTGETMQTHYADCWREHHACAVAEVERLRAENERLTQEVTSAARQSRTSESLSEGLS